MMKTNNGKMTGEFGNWLTNYVQSVDHLSDLKTFYDHGNNSNPNVVAIKGFYGKQVSNRNRLADVDVMIVNNMDEIVLLIEIEETTISPKKLLGDVFSILFCDRMAVKSGDEQTMFHFCPKTQLIVAGVMPIRGYGSAKVSDVIWPRLRQFVVPKDTLQIENISFVFGDAILDLLEKLKREVIRFLLYE